MIIDICEACFWQIRTTVDARVADPAYMETLFA